MNPTILGVTGPGFLNQVPALYHMATWSLSGFSFFLLAVVRGSRLRVQVTRVYEGFGGWATVSILSALNPWTLHLCKVHGTCCRTSAAPKIAYACV